MSNHPTTPAAAPATMPLDNKNSTPGTCYQCGAAVPAGKGQLIRNNGKAGRFVAVGVRWLLRCHACQTKPANAKPIA